MFIGAQTPVYEGMIIGVSAKNMDMTVNPIKNKKMTAVRSTGNDEAMKLVPPKKYLTAIDRRRHARELGKIENESDE